MDDQADPTDAERPRGRTRGRWVVAVVVTLLMLGAAVRVYRHVAPWGASPLPWLLGRVDGPQVSLGDGRVARFYYNDAGAMHSGNGYVWLVESDPWRGRSVVAGGYAHGTSPVTPPCHVDDAGNLVLEFVAGRYDSTPRPVTVPGRARPVDERTRPPSH